jgi:hypothetical protein
MKVEKTVIEEKRLQIMALLDESHQLYIKWGNQYRIMEILDLKAELIDRYKLNVFFVIINKITFYVI